MMNRKISLFLTVAVIVLTVNSLEAKWIRDILSPQFITDSDHLPVFKVPTPDDPPVVEPAERAIIVARYLGKEALKDKIKGNKKFTGISVPEEFQLGTSGCYFCSFVQMYQDKVGMFLSTWGIPHDMRIEGGGPHMVYWYEWSEDNFPKLWQTEDSELVFQVLAKMPYLYPGLFSIPQLSLIFYAMDGNQNIFAYVIALFDPRGFDCDDYVSWDGYVNFISTALRPGLKYSTPGIGSELIKTFSWKNWKKFQVHITRENILNAIRELKEITGIQYSEDPSDYRLWAVGILLEIGDWQGTHVEVGTSFKKFKVMECSKLNCHQKR